MSKRRAGSRETFNIDQQVENSQYESLGASRQRKSKKAALQLLAQDEPELLATPQDQDEANRDSLPSALGDSKDGGGPVALPAPSTRQSFDFDETALNLLVRYEPKDKKYTPLEKQVKGGCLLLFTTRVDVLQRSSISSGSILMFFLWWKWATSIFSSARVP